MMKNEFKMDKLPFEEIQLSRKTSLESVLALAAKQIKKNPKKGRLLIHG